MASSVGTYGNVGSASNTVDGDWTEIISSNSSAGLSSDLLMVMG